MPWAAISNLALTFPITGASSMTSGRFYLPPPRTKSELLDVRFALFLEKHARATPLLATWTQYVFFLTFWINFDAPDLRSARTGAVQSHFSFSGIENQKMCLFLFLFFVFWDAIYHTSDSLFKEMSFMTSSVLGHSSHSAKWRPSPSSERAGEEWGGLDDH